MGPYSPAVTLVLENLCLAESKSSFSSPSITTTEGMQHFEASSNYGWLSVFAMRNAEIKLKGTHQHYNPSETLAAGALVCSTTQQIAPCIFLFSALT